MLVGGAQVGLSVRKLIDRHVGVDDELLGRQRSGLELHSSPNAHHAFGPELHCGPRGCMRQPAHIEELVEVEAELRRVLRLHARQAYHTVEGAALDDLVVDLADREPLGQRIEHLEEHVRDRALHVVQAELDEPCDADILRRIRRRTNSPALREDGEFLGVEA